MALFITWGLLAAVAYLAGLAIYRLYFSPLAKFPGPKLAALSKWYEAYYEIFLKGQFSFHLDKLHERYGPIVRVTPEEVHIRDSDFWDDVFARRPKASRYSSTGARFGNDDSVFAVVDAKHHRILRAPLNPFFSRKAILDQQKLVQDKTELLCKGFDRCRENGTIFRVTDAFAALGGDVISQYSFGFSYGQTEKDGWKENFHDAYISLGAFGHVSVQFPWMNPIMQSLPDHLTAKMDPALAQMMQLRQDFDSTIKKIRQDPNMADTPEKSRTIFHAILQSDLPDSDKKDARLVNEAQTVIGAGIVTTAWALTNAVFYILSNPAILSKLRAELNEAIPNISAPGAFSLEKLEGLPYLTGCIKEGVRHSYGISGRMARVFHEPLVYKDWTVPPGTAVTMSIRDVNFDDEIFEDAKSYKPERWLGDTSKMNRHWVTFGSGPRMCIGINLAYMELYVVLAQVMRRFSMELYETDASDVELAHDFFLPSPKLGSKGVRVKVLKTLD